MLPGASLGVERALRREADPPAAADPSVPAVPADRRHRQRSALLGLIQHSARRIMLQVHPLDTPLLLAGAPPEGPGDLQPKGTPLYNGAAFSTGVDRDIVCAERADAQTKETIEQDGQAPRPAPRIDAARTAPVAPAPSAVARRGGHRLRARHADEASVPFPVRGVLRMSLAQAGRALPEAGPAWPIPRRARLDSGPGAAGCKP
ncbi:hypothetical protein [Eleftheria terrae]|uniref:hypothetical protein n=1 Tax=Eleftheria terrae TaxID=1597781 RepID=UPI00263ACAF8|nr:hypothetical protein [Eleftheria terrae]WKB51184.1 hypothetical protein N7L95_15370 [Eleftheria terrae]